MSYDWSKKMVRAINEYGCDNNFLRVIESNLRWLDACGMVEYAQNSSLSEFSANSGNPHKVFIDDRTKSFFELLDKGKIAGITPKDVIAIKFAVFSLSVYDDILNEAIDLEHENTFELEYRLQYRIKVDGSKMRVSIVPTSETSFGVDDKYNIKNFDTNEVLLTDADLTTVKKFIEDNKVSVMHGNKYL
jgi:hypothetical protein